MSVAEPHPLWCRSLERSQRAFEVLRGTKVAAVACQRATPGIPIDELRFVASRVLEVPAPHVGVVESFTGPECSPWPRAAEADVSVFIAADPDSPDAVQEFLAVAGRAASCLPQAPASVLSRVGIEHLQDAQIGSTRWLAMLFAAGWWSELPGSGLVVNGCRAAVTVPESVSDHFRVCDANGGDRESWAYWIEDVVDASVSLIDSVMAAFEAGELGGAEEAFDPTDQKFTEDTVPGECRSPDGEVCTAKWAEARFGLTGAAISRADFEPVGKLGRAGVFRYRDLADLSDSRS